MSNMTEMRPRWRLLIDGDLPGARNMARDVAILEGVSEDTSPPTLRLYGWKPPCLSLGRHQVLDAVDLGFCRDHGIDVIRRPTGGRALLHHLELTYSLVALFGRDPIPSKLQEAYRTICSALVRWSRDLGVNAELTPGQININLPSPQSAIPCFEAPAGGEVVVGGRKLIGSAMRAHRGAILQHGAILLDWDGKLQAGSMRLTDDSALRPMITTLSEQLGRPTHRHELEQTLATAFSQQLGIRFEEADLSGSERAREEDLLPEFEVDSPNRPHHT
jgi:lipoate-protein ligase A